MDKRPIDLPPLEVLPGGALSGHTFRMRRLSTREYIAFRRGEVDDAALFEAAIGAVEEHSVDIEDLGTLPPNVVDDLVAAWIAAHREAAVPPASGTDSATPSSAAH